MSTPMTFEQFQASKRWSDDLCRDLPDQFPDLEKYPPRGFIYDGTYFVDEVQEWWPNEARTLGRWHLILERDEYISDDLADLERRLYEFAIQSGGLVS